MFKDTEELTFWDMQLLKKEGKHCAVKQRIGERLLKLKLQIIVSSQTKKPPI